MRNKYCVRCFLVLFWGCLYFQSLQAFHIIGGEITYECLGNNTYEFKMFIYRDCQGNGADFDEPAQVAIWRENGGGFRFISQLQVNLQSTLIVAPPDIECLIPPGNVCVQQGFYTFQAVLPVSPESYHITYQRCCRNSSISNILDPNQSGATYTVEINPFAQTECNNSAVFKEFPPTIVCVNQPLTFDHSALDADGDSLVYSFSSPILGGSFDDPAPPGDAPPYANVRFRSPIYFDNAPLGSFNGMSNIAIDSTTGIITGIPQTVGQFVVGIQALEYRDGQLIGRLFRDFQFNVTECESLVDAKIQGDDIDSRYLLTSCGRRTVEFTNLSTIESEIFSYLWDFDLNNGSRATSTDRDATITFPDSGVYRGLMYVNRGTICEDSSRISIRILPETNVDFTSDYDTCIAGPVTFNNLTTTESTGISSFTWDFGGIGSSPVRDPIFQFPEPSTQPVTLTVVDANGCEVIESKNVIYQPAPQTVIVQPNTFLGCEPAQITFVNLSAPVDETYTFNWEFGDGNTSNELSPIHTYENRGVYDVSLEIISPIGCQVEAAFPSLIRVEPGPTADFNFTPQEVTAFNNQVQFVDQSSNAASWFWNFSSEAFSTEENPIYTFRDTGIQDIKLIVTRDNGCQDTISKQLDVIPIVIFHMPNAFTPNNDGQNEEFLGKGILDGMRDFNFTIWNRWGEEIFQSTNPLTGWNGRKNNVGANSPVGSYPYLVTFNGPRGEPYLLKGQANLIR